MKEFSRNMCRHYTGRWLQMLMLAGFVGILSCRKESTEGNHSRALALCIQGDHEDDADRPEAALNFYLECKNLDPSNAPAWVGIANVACKLHRPDIGLTAISNLMLLRPQAKDDANVQKLATAFILMKPSPSNPTNGSVIQQKTAHALEVETVRQIYGKMAATQDITERRELASRAREMIAPFVANPDERDLKLWQTAGSVALANEDQVMAALTFEAIGRLEPGYVDDARLLTLMGQLNALPIETTVTQLKTKERKERIISQWRKQVLGQKWEREISAALLQQDSVALRALEQEGADLKPVLYEKLQKGNKADAMTIIDSGVNLSGRHYIMPSTVICDEVWKKHVSRLKSSGADIDIRDEIKGAIHRHSIPELQQIIATGCSIGTSNTDSLREISSAMWSDNPQWSDVREVDAAVKMLVEAGARIETEEKGSSVLFSEIANYGFNNKTYGNRLARLAYINALVKAKASLQWSYTQTGRNMLHLAAIDGDPDLVTLLLSSGMDPRARDKAGNTPRSLANDPRVIEMLELAESKDSGGVGINMNLEPDGIHIAKLATNGPAARSGMKVGYIIVSVDGVDTKGISKDDAVKLLRGRIGSSVSILAHDPNGSNYQYFELNRADLDRVLY